MIRLLRTWKRPESLFLFRFSGLFHTALVFFGQRGGRGSNSALKPAWILGRRFDKSRCPQIYCSWDSAVANCKYSLDVFGRFYLSVCHPTANVRNEATQFLMSKTPRRQYPSPVGKPSIRAASPYRRVMMVELNFPRFQRRSAGDAHVG